MKSSLSKQAAIALIGIATFIVLCGNTKKPAVGSYGGFAQPSSNKDTLYLLSGDPVSYKIDSIWKIDTARKKPAIVFVSLDVMESIKKKYGEDTK